MASGVVVIGQIGRDLVLRLAGLPGAGGSAPVLERHELLGGKGANQAVGLAQLGAPVSLIGVVGDDAAGRSVLREAAHDGIDVAAVGVRGSTALLVDIVDEQANRRLFEDVPDLSLVTEGDLDRAEAVLAAADTVSIQLQQPARTVLAAARRARRRGAKVVADGVPDASIRAALLASVDVLRADAAEAELLAGGPIRSTDQGRAFGRELVDSGPELVALAIPDAGDLLVWKGGDHLCELSDVPVLDPTGAGDAFTAALVVAVRGGADPLTAGRFAAKAASSTVQRLGGRPDLSSLREWSGR